MVPEVMLVAPVTRNSLPARYLAVMPDSASTGAFVVLSVSLGDSGLSPALFFAETVNWYVVDAVSPVIVVLVPVIAAFVVIGVVPFSA
jgi:hypothetical protein